MSRASRLLLTRLVAALFLLSSSVAFAEDVKVGFVDRLRAVNETEDGKKAQATLKKTFEQKQKELDEQQAQYKKDAEDLEKKRTLLPADKVREKDAELQMRLQKIQATYLRHQQDLSNKEQEALAKISDRMTRIINKMAASENFTMIIDKPALVFAKPHLDLTNELIRRYNAGEGSDPKGGAPNAAAPAPAKPKK